jgi:hypothetical protein
MEDLGYLYHGRFSMTWLMVSAAWSVVTHQGADN